MDGWGEGGGSLQYVVVVYIVYVALRGLLVLPVLYGIIVSLVSIKPFNGKNKYDIVCTSLPCLFVAGRARKSRR